VEQMDIHVGKAKSLQHFKKKRRKMQLDQEPFKSAWDPLMLDHKDLQSLSLLFLTQSKMDSISQFQNLAFLNHSFSFILSHLL
jgi:hypothetical protein